MPFTASESGSDAKRLAFVAEAERVLTGLRKACGELLLASPKPITRAADLQRTLGVGAAIAWQLYRLATAEMAFAASTFVPRTGSMRRLLKAAKDRGFRRDAVEEADRAYAAFSRLVVEHAGDRDTFDAMITPMGEDAGGTIELRHRRAAFRANAQVWGFQASAIYRACICRPAAGGLPERVAVIAGFVDLRQLRATMPVPLLRRKVYVEHSGSVSAYDVSASGPHVIEAFSTVPPGVIKTFHEPGAVADTLTLKGVGRASSETCFLTDAIAEGLDRAPDVPYSMGLLHSVPCETLIIDLLVERGFADPSRASMHTHGNPSNVDGAMTRAEALRMPMREAARYLGTALDALHTPEVPRCPDLLRNVLECQGWAGVEFDIVRGGVRYPILHTAVSIDVPQVAR